MRAAPPPPKPVDLERSPFPRRFATIDGAWRAYRQVKCARPLGCGHVERDVEPVGWPPVSDAFLVQKYRRLGWWVSARGGQFLCPACRAGKRRKGDASTRALTPGQRRAAYVRIDSLEKDLAMHEPSLNPVSPRPDGPPLVPMPDGAAIPPETAATMPPARPSELTHKERKHLVRVADPHIEEIDDEFCRYLDDWSDERVTVEVFGDAARVAQVAGWRLKAYGKIREYRPKKGAADAALAARVERLERQITELAAGLGAELAP